MFYFLAVKMSKRVFKGKKIKYVKYLAPSYYEELELRFLTYNLKFRLGKMKISTLFARKQ
jgi:hypothetical protein